MKSNLPLPLSVLGVFLCVQHTLAVTEILRVWQEYDVRSLASGWSITNDQLVNTTENKKDAGAQTLEGGHAVGVSSSAPFASAAANYVGWGWRTNLTGDTFDLKADLTVIATKSANPNIIGSQSSGADASYKQIYEFSVYTITEGSEVVTVDVPHLTFNFSSLESVYYSDLSVAITRTSPKGLDRGHSFRGPGSHAFVLPDGDYRMTISMRCAAYPQGFYATGGSISISNSVRFSNLTGFPGWSLSNPIKNPVSCRFCYDFRDIPKGSWVASSVTSSGYSIQMLGDAKFTGIMGFPPGFGNSFEVVAGGVSRGIFSTNQSMTFDPPVSSFQVRNVVPEANGSTNTTDTFPILLDYDTPTADFVILPAQTLAIQRASEGKALIYFTGHLQRSVNFLEWQNVPESHSSPYPVTPGTQPVTVFYRTQGD